ncbi:MAG: phasin family protein [Bacillota bacterium]|jgi:polyhydroxyalkanoate synthesis regulator phasin
MENISLRDLVLAGIGSMAYTMEKGMNLVDQLVKKGELTVNQGKELNRELLNRFQGKQAQPDQAVIKEIIASINPATKEDFHNLEARVSRLEKQLP